MTSSMEERRRHEADRASAPEASTASAPRRPGLILAVCCVSMVIVVMDLSIVNIALPALRTDFDSPASDLAWTVGAYALVMAALLVPSGAIADRFGRRRVFLIGLAVFGAGSLACALAPTVGWLVAARVLQAVGGTMLNPPALAIVRDAFPDPARRARAIGVFGSMSGLALALGPVVGGALIGGFGWRAVFAVNLPVVVLALVAAARVLPRMRSGRPRPLDIASTASLAVLLASVVFALMEAGSLGWTSPLILVAVVLAVASLAALVIVSRTSSHPLLDPELVHSRHFVGAVAMAVVALCAFQVFLFTATIYLQEGLMLSPWQAGLGLVPIGVLVLVLSPSAGRVTARRGARTPLVVAGLALTVAGVALLVIPGGTAEWLLVLPLIAIGVFLGFVNPPISNTAVAGVPSERAGLAAALASTGRQTGTALGAAIAGAVLAPSLAAASPAGALETAGRPLWILLIALGVALTALAVTCAPTWPRGQDKTGSGA